MKNRASVTREEHRPGRWRWLIVVEVILCFSPLIVALLIGLIYLPLQLQLLLSGANTLLYLGQVFGGFAGVIGIIGLLRKYMHPGARAGGNRLIIACLCAGFLAMGYSAFSSLSGDMTILEVLMFGLPTLCAIHVLYVTRSILTG